MLQASIPTETEHLDAEGRVVKFSYHKPADFKRAKVSVRLGHTDVLRASVQVIREGGENNLHYHATVDGMFTVLAGRVRFYGPDNKVIGEFGRLEGVIVPRNARYWFESISEEEAEVMLVQAFHVAGAEKSGRTDAAPRKLKDAGNAAERYSAVVERG